MQVAMKPSVAIKGYSVASRKTSAFLFSSWWRHDKETNLYYHSEGNLPRGVFYFVSLDKMVNSRFAGDLRYQGDHVTLMVRLKNMLRLSNHFSEKKLERFT